MRKVCCANIHAYRARSFEVIYLTKGTDESVTRMVHHDPSDLGSLILTQITLKALAKRTGKKSQVDAS